MGSVVIINNKPYKFNNFEKEIMAKRGINAGIVSKRVRGCWEFSEALDAPYGMHLKEYREMKQMEKIKQARLERELERERKKEAELRKKKPHLFNVPQKHSRDPYWFDVTYNQKFKKWSEA
ncbi:SA1788 family PVL leukocidin-associated protein [Staphylococcus aureus]|nr:SA1788 family PVL leukocidin-associated protein [Staphylococcus aureus]MDN8905435.1 SA1788 family PVL leukocidin-associated protein [Staphylococcus aureus]MDN8921272.1 SA1788 family PVL leukocidin-associated protein [Staphylococcus aureus]